MNYRSILVSAVLLSPLSAIAQAVPTASAPIATSGLNLGVVNGTFRYGASASEVFQTGYGPNGDLSEQTNLSGSLIYATKSLKTPFSAIYSGGVQFSNIKGYGTTTFQSLALSQGYVTRNWTFGISDIVSYLPQSPTVGLSGIPGVGDIGLTPVTGVDVPAQNILTYNTSRVSNTVTGNVSRLLTSRLSISGDGNYGILDYFNDSSFDTRQISGDVSLNYQVDPRTSVGVGINYSIFDYPNYTANLSPGGDSSFTTRSVNLRAQHQFTRALSAFATVGPQWVNSASGLGIPSRLNVAVTAGGLYARRFGTLGVFYTRGVNGGSGVVPGAFADSFSGSFSREFGHNWAASANVGYTRTSSLTSGTVPQVVVLPGFNNYGNFNSTFAGAQLTRRISRSFSAFASYTGSKQTYGRVVNTPGAIDGLVQSFAIGVSYFPRSTNLGQF